ncbi:metalloprotease TldD, partial [Staphylococcus condimenti]
AYSNAITADALRQAAQAARSIARSGQQGQVKVLGRAAFAPLYRQDNPLDGLRRAEKVDLLKRIDVATRALDPRIKQVTVSLAGVW